MASELVSAVQPVHNDRFRRQFAKTRQCNFFQQGRCNRGSNCTFAHGDAEHAPDLTKTSLCKKWKSGTCPHSSATCPFAHGKRELRTTPHYAALFHSKDKGPPTTHVPMPFSMTPRSDVVDSMRLDERSIPEPPGLEGMKALPPFLAGSGADRPLVMPSKICSPYGQLDRWEKGIAIGENNSLMYSSEPWEGDTATGETSSEDDRSYPTMTMRAQQPVPASRPKDLNAQKSVGYSPFSGGVSMRLEEVAFLCY